VEAGRHPSAELSFPSRALPASNLKLKRPAMHHCVVAPVNSARVFNADADPNG
jgi:hypothetical protein